MAVVLLPLMFLCVACNEEVSDGVITCNMRNYNNGYIGFEMYESYIAISSANNFYCDNNYGYQDGEFVDIGTKRISKIKNIPTQGWASSVAVLPGHGYIFRTKHVINEGYENFWDGSYWYGRIYVVDYIESASSGGIIGAEVQYKESSAPGVLD